MISNTPCTYRSRTRTTPFNSLALGLAVSLLLVACAGTPAETSTTALPPATDPPAPEVTVPTEPFDPVDSEWDSPDVVRITFATTTVSTTSADVDVTGTTATITSAGKFRLSGDLADGQVVVNAPGGVVRILFDGVSIHNDTGPALVVLEAEQTLITLGDASENTLTSGPTYSAANTQLNATLYSKRDLAIDGNGTLSVVAVFDDGITSTKDLRIVSGTYLVDAADDGIRGKNRLVIEDGTFTVTAGGDGFKADNKEDPDLGHLTILDGGFTVVAAGDGFVAANSLTIESGEFDIVTTGAGRVSSSKGLKARRDLTVVDGVFVIKSVDDALSSKGNITILGGTLTLDTDDDGIDADGELTIEDGVIDVVRSDEGMEASAITINGGEISIVSSDDGINVAGDDDRTGDTNRWLRVTGGVVVIDAEDDGIDVKGSWEMSGGLVVVHGPTSRGSEAIDYRGTFEISGGTLIVVDRSTTIQAPSVNSSQAFVTTRFGSVKSSAIQIQDVTGKVLITFEPRKSYTTVLFSSPDLVAGATYEFFIGAVGSGTSVGGVYPSSSSPGSHAGSGKSRGG